MLQTLHLMPLHCTGYEDYMIEYSNQTNCRTYFSNGALTFVNRYSLREWSHNNIDQANSHDDLKTFEMFVHEVNIQDKYNKVNGPILAVPIVAYHMIDNTKTPDSTDVTSSYIRTLVFRKSCIQINLFRRRGY
jgi:hypothetical protein